MIMETGRGSIVLSGTPPDRYRTIPLMAAKQAQENTFQQAPCQAARCCASVFAGTVSFRVVLVMILYRITITVISIVFGQHSQYTVLRTISVLKQGAGMTVLKGIFGSTGQVVSFVAAKDKQFEQRIRTQFSACLKEIRGLMVKKAKTNPAKMRVSTPTYPQLT